MSAIFDITEETKVVNAYPAGDINGTGGQTDWLHLKEAKSCQFLVQFRVTGAATTITLEEASDNTGTGNTAIAFRYRAEEVDSGDTWDGEYQTATTSGFVTSANDNIMYFVRIDAVELSSDKPYLSLLMSDPAVATGVNVAAFLVNPRYAGKDIPTVLT